MEFSTFRDCEQGREHTTTDRTVRGQESIQDCYRRQGRRQGHKSHVAGHEQEHG